MRRGVSAAASARGGSRGNPAGSYTRPLLTSTSDVFFTDRMTPPSVTREKCVTLSRKVDGSKPLEPGVASPAPRRRSRDRSRE